MLLLNKNKTHFCPTTGHGRDFQNPDPGFPFKNKVKIVNLKRFLTYLTILFSDTL
jgi:hypothetical protein